MTNDNSIMPLLHFHTVGDWDARRVRTAWVAGSLVVPAEVREVVDRTWRSTSARPGVKLFDGAMCRLESWSAGVDGLHLALSRTSYKLFLGTNMTHPELADRYGRGVMANPVGVSPVVESADGFLLMGRRNAAVAYYPNRVHPFAGALEPDDDATAAAAGAATGPGPDVFAAVRRELAEELSFDADDVADVRCTGIAEDLALRQPELVFRVSSTRTRQAIEAQIGRDEHHAAHVTPATREGVAASLSDPLLTPIAVASMLLWGRATFGQDWFEQHSRRFDSA